MHDRVVWDDTEVVFFDLFSGMDGLGHALRKSAIAHLLNIKVAVIQFETDPYCRSLLRQHSGPGFTLSDYEGTEGVAGSVLALVDDNFARLREILKWPRKLRAVIVVAGSPCQGLSAAGMGRGFDDERSELVWTVPAISAYLVRMKLGVGYMLENVSSMKDHHRDAISRAMGSQPTLLDASSVAACDRGRLFWTSWGTPGITSVDVDPASVLEEGWRPLWEIDPRRQVRHKFRTFTRPFPPGMPSECPVDFPRLSLPIYDARGLVYRPDASPADLDTIRALTKAAVVVGPRAKKALRTRGSPEVTARVALARWIHQQGGDRALRPLSGDERDRALGFPSGASSATEFADELDPGLEYRRWQVTGNAFSPVVIDQVMAPVFAAIAADGPMPNTVAIPDYSCKEDVMAVLRSRPSN